MKHFDPSAGARSRMVKRLPPALIARAKEAADAVAILGKFPVLRVTSRSQVATLSDLKHNAEDVVMNAFSLRCRNAACPWGGEVIHSSGDDSASRLEKASPRQKMLLCSACKNARYCSPECQKADWKDHKPMCKQIQEMVKTGQQVDLSTLDSQRGTEDSRIGIIDTSTVARQAFNSMVSRLLHRCAAPLGALFLAWRSRVDTGPGAPALMRPVVVIEIDHEQAAANGWKGPFAWSAFPYYGMLSGSPPYPGYTGPRPDLHAFLRDEVKVEQMYYWHLAGPATGAGAAGTGVHAAIADPLYGWSSGKSVFVVVLTTAVHRKFCRVQVVSHMVENMDFLEEALAGKPLAKKGQSASTGLPAVHASSGADLHAAAYYMADSILVVEPAAEDEMAVPTAAYAAPYPTLGPGAPNITPFVTHETRKVSARAAMHDAMQSVSFSSSPDAADAVELALESVGQGLSGSIEAAGAARGVQRLAWPMLVPWRNVIIGE